MQSRFLYSAAVPLAIFLGAAAFIDSTPAQTRLTTLRVASGFSSPVFLCSPPGDTERLFVVERGGAIKILRGGIVAPVPFLNVASKIQAGGESGLLGLAFHPNYATNGAVFVSYTRNPDGGSILERYTVSANPDVADPASATVLFGPVSQPFSNHNGGCIQFGPDGYLYFGLGDGGAGGDPQCNAQNPGSHLGKMLRLDVDNPNSIVPGSNPFVGNASYRPEIWAVGLRNPWRFSFDRETGDLLIGDVGQGRREEISFQSGASTGGENYGWKIMEGDQCFGTSSCQPGIPTCNSAALTLPIHTYATGSNCSITGGYVYRGCAVPSLRGSYFFGDFCSGRTWSFEYSNGQLTSLRERTAELGRASSLSSFGEDAMGELYIVRLGGTIDKIVPTGQGPATDLGFGKIGGNGVEPFFSVCGLLTAGESAEFRVDNAPANAISALLIGRANNPTVFPPFGTLVPTPVRFSLARMTDASGTIRFTLPGGTGATTAYAQWAFVDAGASGGVGLSNALELRFQ